MEPTRSQFTSFPGEAVAAVGLLEMLWLPRARLFALWIHEVMTVTVPRVESVVRTTLADEPDSVAPSKITGEGALSPPACPLKPETHRLFDDSRWQWDGAAEPVGLDIDEFMMVLVARTNDSGHTFFVGFAPILMDAWQRAVRPIPVPRLLVHHPWRAEAAGAAGQRGEVISHSIHPPSI